MLRLIGMILGVIAFIWFMIPFTFSGVINIGNITGMIAAAGFTLYTMFLPTIQKQENMMWIRRCAIGIVVTILILVIVETSCIISACMKTPAENATAVVLGCRVYGERPSLSLVERLEAAYAYLEKNPEAVCIVSGGQGDGENISEAEAMYRWLVAKGIEKERIYIEDRSTSTEENIAFSKQIIEENGLNLNIAIVTSEYHTYRAGIIAKQNNLSFGAAPGHTAWWTFPTFYVRELYAILAEWIF